MYRVNIERKMNKFLFFFSIFQAKPFEMVGWVVNEGQGQGRWDLVSLFLEKVNFYITREKKETHTHTQVLPLI